MEVVPVQLKTHPNADSLSIVDVFGFKVIVKTADWVGAELGAYLPPDSMAPDSEQFKFLDGHRRIRAKKLRGVQSFGLLMPAPAGAKIGDDVAELMGVTHYEPELHLYMGGEVEKPPVGFVGSKYDVDSLRRYPNCIQPGELCLITEKLHGASSRYVFKDGTMHVGSRAEWKRENASNQWWKSLAVTPELRKFCEDNPGLTVYGEVYGQVGGFGYGRKGIGFAAFDLARADGTWFDAIECRSILSQGKVPQVPLLDIFMPFDFDKVVAMAEGKSTVPGSNHVREGCVVKPMIERWFDGIGRVCLKAVGAGYLEKS